MNTSDQGPGRGDDYYCGGRLRDGSGKTCRRRAGHGTPTPGVGRCKLHGGNTPSHRRRAERAEAELAVATYGLPREVDPRAALLEEVHRTAGHVAWLGQLVAELEHGGSGYRQDTIVDGEEERTIYVPLTGLKQLSKDGKFEKPSVWVELYQQERRHLREVCRDAASAGVEERAVRLAEQQGMALAGAVRAILGDLNLSQEQLALVPAVVPKHLRALSSNGNGSAA